MKIPAELRPCATRDSADGCAHDRNVSTGPSRSSSLRFGRREPEFPASLTERMWIVCRALPRGDSIAAQYLLHNRDGLLAGAAVNIHVSHHAQRALIHGTGEQVLGGEFAHEFAC